MGKSARGGTAGYRRYRELGKYCGVVSARERRGKSIQMERGYGRINNTKYVCKNLKIAYLFYIYLILTS